MSRSEHVSKLCAVLVFYQKKQPNILYNTHYTTKSSRVMNTFAKGFSQHVWLNLCCWWVFFSADWAEIDFLIILYLVIGSFSHWKTGLMWNVHITSYLTWLTGKKKRFISEAVSFILVFFERANCHVSACSSLLLWLWFLSHPIFFLSYVSLVFNLSLWSHLIWTRAARWTVPTSLVGNKRNQLNGTTPFRRFLYRLTPSLSH